MRKRIVPLAVLLVGILLIVVVKLLPPRRQPPPSTGRPPVNVEVMTVSALPELPDSFTVPGVAEPNRVVNIAAEVPGRVERLALEEGERVEAGALIMELNRDILQADFDRFAAQVARDKTELERVSSLVKGGAAPDRDLEDAGLQLATNSAQLQAARMRLDRTRIFAPISGVLNEIRVEAGEYVNEGMRVAQIVETETMKVVVEVPERDVSFFQRNAPVTIRARSADAERTLAGCVTYLSEVADPATRSSRMEISVENRDRLLHGGQILQVLLTRRMIKDAIMVPLQAVIPLEEGASVYVADDGKAVSRVVTLGVIRGREVQIVSGLSIGEKVIVTGHRFVGPGQSVRIVKSDGTPAPDAGPAPATEPQPSTQAS